MLQIGNMATSNGPVVATAGLSQFVRGVAETHEDLSNQSCQACLVTRPATAAGITVEGFVERNVVSPVGIVVEHRRTVKHWPFALLVAQKYPGQSAGQFQSHLLKRLHLPGAGRTLDLKSTAVITVILSQCLDDKKIDRKPNRPTPV